jgi:hypothetical protein
VPLKIPAEVQAVIPVTTVIPVLAPREEDHQEVSIVVLEADKIFGLKYSDDFIAICDGLNGFAPYYYLNITAVKQSNRSHLRGFFFILFNYS